MDFKKEFAAKEKLEEIVLSARRAALARKGEWIKKINKHR
jgi:hypothetical protein